MKTLGLRTLEDIYDTKAVGGIIQSLVSEWNIGCKVCSITVDNSFLDDSMIQQIKENCLSDQTSLSSAHWFISFTLLEDGFREMDDLLFKLKKSIRYVTETRHGKLKLQEAVDQVKLQGGKSLDDLSFKRESDFDILDSALRSREIFCKLEQIDGNFKLNPSMEEWENAAALQSCLRCFDDIKGTQSLTVSLYFPKLCDIYKKFLQLEKSNHPFVPSMKRKFDYYWILCSLAFAVAAVLDPRLKFKFVEFSYTEIYGRDRRMHLNGFNTFLRDIYYKYADEANNLTESTSFLGDSNCSSTEPTNDCLLDSFRKFESASNLNEEASELDCYLNEPLLPLDGAFFDILDWWRVNSQRFPILEKIARDFLTTPISVSAPCAVTRNPDYSSLNSETMEALVCSQNWLETPKENDGENHEPTQTTDKGKRKLDEDTCVRKKSKPSNYEKATSTEDIAKDSNNSGKISKNGCYRETSSGNKSKASNKMDIHQEKSSSEINHGRNFKDVNEILSGDSSSDNDQSDQVQSSSSESDDEATLKEQGQWCEQDVRVYLVSNFTNKDYERLDKLERKKLNRKSIGRDKELDLTGDKLEPLLMVPRSTKTPKNYHINEVVINAFFKLLKKRSHKFPKAFISRYSFDSQVANLLIKGSRSEQDVLARYKPDQLSGVHKLFLPLCLSDHWVPFYVDINVKKFSCLDPYQSSGILSFNSKNVDKILQWFKSFLLPEFGYRDANEWPYVVRNDIPQQKNSVNCGVFVMKYGDCLTYGGDFFPFTQKDMIHFRRRIFLDLYRGRLHIKK